MTVYVDDMNLPATVQNGPRVSHTSEWSHLFADTEDELHAFAARLGLKRSYFQQGKPDWFPHYDVTKGKRFQALRLGAEPISARDTAVMAREHRTRCGDIGCTEHPGDDPAALAERGGVPLDVHEVTTTAEAYPRGTPAPLTDAGRAALADRYAYDAGHAWKAGDLAKAARLVRQAAEQDPSRPELWAARQQQIQDRAARTALAAQTAARLAAAGISPCDPGLQQLAGHNAALGLRREPAGGTRAPAADKEAGQ